jgi:hypothetical protein
VTLTIKERRLECKSNHIHLALFRYEQKLKKWMTTSNRTRSDALEACLGEMAAKGATDCNRLRIKLWGILRVANAEFQRLHPRFWEACGNIASGFLPNADLQRDTPLDPQGVLAYLHDSFRNNEWPIRTYVMKGFQCVVEACPYWDVRIVEHAWSYQSCCVAGVLAYRLTGSIPDTIVESVFCMTEIWCTLAERFKQVFQGAYLTRKERQVACLSLLKAAIELIDLINMTWEQINTDAMNRLREMVIANILCKEQVSEDVERLYVSRKAYKKLEEFQNLLEKLAGDKTSKEKSGRFASLLEEFQGLLDEQVFKRQFRYSY